MKTTTAPPVKIARDCWTTLPDTAKALHCSTAAMHGWGKSGKFGYRQTGPRETIVNLNETVAFYTKKFPRVELDYDAISDLMQSTT